MVLVRVPKAKIAEYDAYEFFSGSKANGERNAAMSGP